MTENNDELRKVWNLIHKYQTEGLSRDQIKSKLIKKGADEEIAEELLKYFKKEKIEESSGGFDIRAIQEDNKRAFLLGAIVTALFYYFVGEKFLFPFLKIFNMPVSNGFKIFYAIFMYIFFTGGIIGIIQMQKATFNQAYRK